MQNGENRIGSYREGVGGSRGMGVGRGGGGVWGYPRDDRKFLGNFPMISGKFSEISRKFPGSRGMSPVT